MSKKTLRRAIITRGTTQIAQLDPSSTRLLCGLVPYAHEGIKPFALTQHHENTYYKNSVFLLRRDIRIVLLPTHTKNHRLSASIARYEPVFVLALPLL